MLGDSFAEIVSIFSLPDHGDVALSRDSLQITNARYRDGGLYACKAKNDVGSVEHKMKVILEGKVRRGKPGQMTKQKSFDEARMKTRSNQVK